MITDKVEALKWMKKQLELWPGDDSKEMAGLTGEMIDFIEEAPAGICYLTIPEAEACDRLDDHTAFVTYLGNDITMIWEPVDGLHIQGEYHEFIIPPEKVEALLEVLQFILRKPA